MARTGFKSVDEYIAAHPEGVQAILRKVRSTIRKAVARAEEGISYQIPAYKLHGEAVVYFAGFKQHYSLYPATAGLVAAMKGALGERVVSKGTIRFSFEEAVPVGLIARIARFRAREAAERAKAKAPRSKAGRRDRVR
jgi:uncharacterized protein YdhG (YjbR/CyaY superfamily)